VRNALSVERRRARVIRVKRNAISFTRTTIGTPPSPYAGAVLSGCRRPSSDTTGGAMGRYEPKDESI
jgi:hypothetical protein